MHRLLAPFALALLACPACSAAPSEEDASNDADEAEVRTAEAPVYLAQAVLTANPNELYDKLTVTPSAVARGAKVTGPGLFGIVCARVAADESCTLNWLQRRDDASSSFILSGPVAKAIALALPEKDRAYENGDVKFRCDVQKGGMLSADGYRCSFTGLTPKLTEVKGRVNITPNVELSEADARSAIGKLFPTM